ncbi:hypothetical protein PCASD_00638 [Puccinia coronata f. sp. avenae]|nr:hypothetical protein PCASD_00638 [Puccinia coronata f. sp. avenae]
MAGISPIYSTGTEHKVNVGKNGSTFDPSHISAKKGDTITFVFFQDGHTLTQTHFANPCAGTNPPSDSFCTVTSASSTNDSSSYPTGSSDYPTEGLQPNVSSNYPTSSDPQKDPDTNTTSSPPTEPSTPTKPADPVSTPTVKDPSSNPGSGPASPSTTPAACLCPAPVNTSSAYPTAPDPTTPKKKTCDSKCIEVSGQCQNSTDCDAQSKSPSDTKCKMEDGKCKKCGQSSLLRKRGSSSDSFTYFRKLLRRDTLDDTVQKVDVSNTAATSQTDGSTQLDTSPTSQDTNLLTSAVATSSTGQTSSSPTGTDSTTSSVSSLGVGSSSTVGQDASIGLGTNNTDGGASANPSGLDSGFVKVSEEQKSTGKSWKIQITDDSKPLWFMCATINHCTTGMVFAVNPPDSGDKTFDKFVQAAKASTCPTQYPTKTNLQGDGCTAAAPPCDGKKKENAPADTPPVSSGGNTELPKTPTTPE